MGMVRPDCANNGRLYRPGHHIMPEKAVACISGRAARQSTDTGRTGGCVGTAASVWLYGFGAFAVCADGVFLQSRPLCRLPGPGITGMSAQLPHDRAQVDTQTLRRHRIVDTLRAARKHEPFGLDSGCSGLPVGMDSQRKSEASTPYYI